MIPFQDKEGRISSLQYISPSGEKKYAEGSKSSRAFCPIIPIESARQILLTEGWATGHSLQQIAPEVFEHAVVVSCGSVSNIPLVAEIFREKYPEKEIIIAPDRPKSFTPSDPVNIAVERCRDMGIDRVIYPLEMEKGDDWNDAVQAFSVEEIADDINRQLQEAKISKDEDVTEVFVEDSSQSIPEIENILENLDDDPCKDLSMEHFPPVLKTYIESICETTEAHPIMIVMSVICSISAMVGKKAYMPDNEYFQNLYPNIWSLCITKSGGFKSTALNKGSEIALEEDRRILQTMKDIKNRENPNYSLLEDDKSFSDGLKKELREESLKRPILPTRISTEFLIKHLAEGYKGMILSSEMGEWLGNMQKQHNVDLKQIFTCFYDVDIIPYEHRTKHCGNYIVEKPFVTINGVSTISWIEGQVKADDVFSGFFARVLLFNPPSEDKIPNARPKKIKDSAKGIEAKRKIAETLENLGEVRFAFSEETKSQFDAIHISIYQMVRSGSHDERCQRFLEPYLKRWPPYILKLAMLFRIIEDPLSDKLNETSLKAATEIVRIAIKSTAKLFKKELGESIDQRKQRKVYEWIAKRSSKKRKTPYSSLIKSRILDGGSKEYDEILGTLENAGKIKCSNPKTENKKDLEYVLV